MRGTLLVSAACAWAASGKDLPYSEETAVKYAALSQAAYCGLPRSPDESVENWQCGPACDAVPGMKSVRVLRTENNDDAFAYVGKLPGGFLRSSECVLSFRGTTNFAGWVLNIESGDRTDLNGWGVDCSFEGSPCMVGRGWVKNYANIQDSILGNLSDIGCGPGSTIAVTGHSLGAAEAGIAMMDLNNRGYTIAQTYTFGQPRIGNSAFVSAFEKAFGTQRVMRLTHYYDPVPHLPPTHLGFSHVPQEIYYERESADGYRVCDGSGEDQGKCSDQWKDLPLMIADCIGLQVVSSTCDHLSYLKGIVPFKMDGETCAGSFADLVSV